MLDNDRANLIDAMMMYGSSKIEGNIAERMYRKGWFDCLVSERCLTVDIDNDDYIRVSYPNGMEFAHWQR